MNQCKTCRFFDLLNEEHGQGHCLRYPPQAQMVLLDGSDEPFKFNFNPSVSQGHTCGEWKHKEGV